MIHNEWYTGGLPVPADGVPGLLPLHADATDADASGKPTKPLAQASVCSSYKKL